jgi:Family of unknown function (DUF6069)
MAPPVSPSSSRAAERKPIGSQGGPLDRVLRLIHFDLSPEHRPPAATAVALAAVVSLVGSLLADWLLAKLAVAVFPSTKGYQHFQFSDYATLTILGVVVACIAWPIVTRLCAEPRWLFMRMAVVVTAVLLLPDLAIFVQGQPGDAVLFLVLMHLAIGVITYNALVRLAPTRKAFPSSRYRRGI